MSHIITVTTTNASDSSVNTGKSSNAVLDSDDSCVAPHRSSKVSSSIPETGTEDDQKKEKK